MKKSVSYLLSTLAALLISFLFYWFSLPPIHLRSPLFWRFVITLLIVWLVCFEAGKILRFLRGVATGTADGTFSFHAPDIRALLKRAPFRVAAVALVIVAVLLLGDLAGAEIFHANAYRDLITISEGNFASEVAELSMSQIPVVDKDMAEQLGQRQLGTIPDLVSQFEISDDYTQINVNGRPVRVTPLVYADFFKWWNNQSSGIPGYISVDMATQETTLVRLPQGSQIRYSESELFLRNISRHLRFAYPTKIFGNVLFEVDDTGTPYWIAPTMTYRIALWSGIDVEGAVLCNAITGESQYYTLAEIPQWVDRVFDADLIVRQLDWNGQFQDGFINAYFGQRGVRLVTEGYNYIANNDDVYLYTGMTSATADESNIGFVLVNMRTKETHFYTVPGAEEYSAMASAEGQVQHLNYQATFPLLLNVADRPTYFMSLKDASGLVKMYAFVDVQRYQIVGTGDTVSGASVAYREKLAQSEDIDDISPGETGTKEVSGTVAEISTAVLDGTTNYYLRLQDDPHIYRASLSLSPALPFASPGDTVTLRVADAEAWEQSPDELCTVTSIAVEEAPQSEPVQPSAA